MYSAIDDIIPREMDPTVKDLMEKLNIVLDRFVDFGSNILKWDTEVKRVEAYNTPVIMSFRHFLELVDSISVQVKQSSIDPCKLQLRAMLETYFSLSYMLETDTDKRGMAFLVWHLHKQIKDLTRTDEDSEMGKQLRAKLRKDRHTQSLVIPTDPNAQKKIAAIEALLQKPIYQEAEQEYQRLRAAKEKDPAWYRFYEGPKNIVEMAEHLDYMGLYDVIYRRWSGPIHGTDVITGKASIADDGSAEIYQIRFFGNVQEVAQWALNLSLLMYEYYIDKRIPDKKKDYLDWYMTVREHYIRITGKEPLINVT
ncbi:DUF5677 domain-containing protein [Spirosoma foliorum]|uniref:Uncharacterized protein n=1 Tax=Spirosoma foliorum TaxID=2710596 RepID=A0A7G5GTT9_9BACT|nr:DUF5677 domain-containing protein [Spirosoma foliorum]QMW02281.1 hypothetical protein H3H32_30890 [Spirosoma foliorum]